MGGREELCLAPTCGCQAGCLAQPHDHVFRGLKEFKGFRGGKPNKKEGGRD